MVGYLPVVNLVMARAQLHLIQHPDSVCSNGRVWAAASQDSGVTRTSATVVLSWLRPAPGFCDFADAYRYHQSLRAAYHTPSSRALIRRARRPCSGRAGVCQQARITANPRHGPGTPANRQQQWLPLAVGRLGPENVVLWRNYRSKQYYDTGPPASQSRATPTPAGGGREVGLAG
jgi:hypothetical protein